MKRLTFSCKQKIKHHCEFKETIFYGLRLQIDFLDLRIRENKQKKISRLGVSVSKKIGGSPVRNRMKRIIREWFRTHQYLIKMPRDIVFIVRKRPEQKMNPCALNHLIHPHLTHIGLL